MGFIYKITNDITNKSYIGQTSQTIEDRFKEHLKNSRYYNYHLYNSMNKYGIEHFSIEQIEECHDELLNEREQYWINYYDTFYYGYNETKGGEGRKKYDYKQIAEKYLELQNEKDTAIFFNCSVDTVQKACRTNNIEIKKGLPQSYWASEKGQKRKKQLKENIEKNFKGKKLSEEHKKKISKAKKGKYTGELSPSYGKKHSDKARERMSHNSAWAKIVICIETGEEYSSALQAAKAKGLKNSSGISRCCKKERQTAGGFHWRFKDNQEVEE